MVASQVEAIAQANSRSASKDEIDEESGLNEQKMEQKGVEERTPKRLGESLEGNDRSAQIIKDKQRLLESVHSNTDL